MIAGMKWAYEVTESGKTYQQTIILKSSPENGQYLLSTSSPLRRTEYTISQHNNRILLHKVRGRLSFLPVWRTRSFTPAIPYLDFDSQTTTSWSWMGETKGFGPDFDEIFFHMTPFSESPSDSVANNKCQVTASCSLADGTNEGYKATYEAGIGLVSIVAEGYRKELIEYVIP
jgi:hypothetical protein